MVNFHGILSVRNKSKTELGGDTSLNVGISVLAWTWKTAVATLISINLNPLKTAILSLPQKMVLFYVFQDSFWGPFLFRNKSRLNRAQQTLG